MVYSPMPLFTYWISMREKFIKDCYNHLKPNGYMIFTTVSKKAPMFGKGKLLDKRLFWDNGSCKNVFYDSDSIKQEFGLIEISEIDEQSKDMKNKPPMNFIMIKCKKR